MVIVAHKSLMGLPRQVSQLQNMQHRQYMNYLDKVLYLYPNIQHVMYWHTQPDGKPWHDAYSGLEWNNTEIEKPTKEKLDSIDDGIVIAELEKRKQQEEDAKFAKENPVLHLEESIKHMQVQVDSLKDSISSINTKTEQFINKAAAQAEEINGGMAAIKGFLMMIPDMQKSLSEMQSKINKGN